MAGTLLSRDVANDALAIALPAAAALLLAVITSDLPFRRRRSSALSPEMWAGVAAGLVALGAHSGFDVLWHIPVIPLTAAELVRLVSQHHQSQPAKEQS